MNKALEFANHLDGRQYHNEITPEEDKLAFNNNLLVLFASSDDLLEMRGTIHDEVGAYGGTIIHVSKDGKSFTSKNDDTEELNAYQFLIKRGYKIERPERIYVELKWLDSNWIIDSDSLKQAFFSIYEDDQLFGMGLVIDFS